MLHSLQRIRQHSQVANTVVGLARDIIWSLDDLNRSTDIYSTQQMCFNYFLVLALGVILLAIAQAPELFADSVRDEFYAALDLVQSLSSNSFVSRRLWKFIRGLRPIGNTLSTTRQSGMEEGLQDNPNTKDFAFNAESQNIFEPDIGLLSFADDVLPSFQVPDQHSEENLMENMHWLFEAMDREWRERPR